MGKDNMMNFWYNALTVTVLPWQLNEIPITISSFQFTVCCFSSDFAIAFCQLFNKRIWICCVHRRV